LLQHLHCYPTSSFCLPLINLSLLRQRLAHNLVTVQQTQRVKRLLELPHRIHRIGVQLMREVVTLDETNTVLACRCALELNGALDHVVNEMLGLLVIGLAVVQNDG
jgi:hypothetical protein